MLGIVFVFRAEIGTLLSPRMRRLKAGPFEVEWDRQLSEVTVELDQLGVSPPLEGLPRGPLSEELADVARVSPTAAVMEAYSRVESQLRLQLEAAGAPIGDLRIGAAGLARLAAREGLITEETARAVEGISVLRNLAAHGRAGEVTEERAMDYLALVDGVFFALGHRPT